MRPPHPVVRALADVLALGVEATAAVGLLVASALSQPPPRRGAPRGPLRRPAERDHAVGELLQVGTASER